MKIEKVFETVQTYDRLLGIANKAEPNLSFWGACYISVEGYEGSLHTDAVARRLLQILDKNYEFNERERELGKKISARIDIIYEKEDKILASSNLLTRVLCILRNISLYPDFSFYWNYCEEKDSFEYYTRSQFKKICGRSPEKAKKSGFELQEFCNTSIQPRRWRVINAPRSRWLFGLI